MGTTAGITGGDPRAMTAAERATPVTEHSYGFEPTVVDTKTGTAADAWSVIIDFDWSTRHITLRCVGNNLDIQLSNDGTTFSDSMEIDVNAPLSIPFSAKAMRVRNANAGQASVYHVSGLILY